MGSTNPPRDLRGPLWRIGRLLPFHGEGFLHVVVYRVQVPLTLLYGAVIFLGFAVPGLGALLKLLTAIVWLLWTPQLFEVAKGLSLAWTRGMAFGKLNQEFAHLYRKRYGKKTGLYVALPYLVLALWAAGFVALLLWWQP